jgi:orotate phosphoribosyltransferase
MGARAVVDDSPASTTHFAHRGITMHDELLTLLAARKGHFRFESGHHGDLWLEIPRLYVRPARLRPLAAELARRLNVHRVEAVCGPLVEGALLGQMVALELEADFCFAEQFARPGGDALYPLGYRIPSALRACVAGKRIAIVDDVINAGSAVRGAAVAVRDCGAQTVVIGALLVLGTAGAEFAAQAQIPLETLARMPSNLWEPANCPLCAAGILLKG